MIETVSVEQRAWREVDSDFARLEGEGDLSLAYWREAHRRYFSRNGGFDPNMILWCERFRLVEILPVSTALGSSVLKVLQNR